MGGRLGGSRAETDVKRAAIGDEMWGFSTMKLEPTQLDERRRLVMPGDAPPGSAVIIDAIGSDAWIMRIQHSKANFKLVSIPIIEKLGNDRTWEVCGTVPLCNYAAVGMQ
jgi:hypothetical protein